ncbi:MAG: 2-amino-4-hydroxy-6-hydroxymethyldihydropteridine diphosphokinase [Actinomycetes bacterium]
MKVVIALGSNLGDRKATLDGAVDALKLIITVTKVSSYIETDPVGGPEQPDYLNAVLIGESDLEPTDLLLKMQAIELAAGRERLERWGARTLDLDLILAGGLVMDTELLTLPHPRAHERRFVLDPWLEVDPQAILPGFGEVRLIP